MIARIATLILIFLVPSCTNEPPPEPPSKEEIIELYKAKKDIFVKLRDDVTVDASSSGKLKIDIEFNSTGLSEEKFEDYTKQLKSIPSQRVEIYGGETTFIVFNHGMVFAGCSTLIIHNASQKPSKPEWVKDYLLVELSENWYGETKCN